MIGSGVDVGIAVGIDVVIDEMTPSVTESIGIVDVRPVTMKMTILFNTVESLFVMITHREACTVQRRL